MFSKLSICRDVTDVRAWLTAADPAGGPLEASTAVRLAALWHRVEFDGLRAGPRRRRAWWPNRAERQRRRKLVIGPRGWQCAGAVPDSASHTVLILGTP